MLLLCDDHDVSKREVFSSLSSDPTINMLDHLLRFWKILTQHYPRLRQPEEMCNYNTPFAQSVIKTILSLCTGNANGTEESLFTFCTHAHPGENINEGEILKTKRLRQVAHQLPRRCYAYGENIGRIHR